MKKMKTLGELNTGVQLGYHKENTHREEVLGPHPNLGAQREKDEREEAGEEGEKRSAWLKFSLGLH